MNKKNRGLFFVVSGTLLVLMSLVLNIMSEALYTSFTTVSHKVDVIAHRGLPSEAPENSIEAIDKALKKECKFIEIDVHQTADGAIVVMHDFTLNRTTSLKGLVKNYSLQQIQEYNDQVKMGLVKDGVEIPQLKEVLARVNGRANVIVEVKSGGEFYPGFEESIVGLIKQHKAYSWVQIHSFNDVVLENINALDPDIELHKLLIFYIPLFHLMVDEGVHFRKLKSYDHVSRFSIFYPFANRRFIKIAHDMNKKVNIWSLNNKAKALNYIGLGVDGIITDKADQLLLNDLNYN